MFVTAAFHPSPPWHHFSLPPRCLECCLCKELLEHREALLQCLEMREGLQVRIPVRSTEWDSLVDDGCGKLWHRNAFVGRLSVRLVELSRDFVDSSHW